MNFNLEIEYSAVSGKFIVYANIDLLREIKYFVAIYQQKKLV